MHIYIFDFDRESQLAQMTHALLFRYNEPENAIPTRAMSRP